VVHDADQRLLLVRRGRPPGRGLWSVPGGRVEPGESPTEAVVREVLEETGLLVVPTGRAGVVERPAPGGVFVIEDFVAVPAAHADPSALRAGDDAEDVGWFTLADMTALSCVEGLGEALARWRLLPR
jgi:ADP-ribose pyrophosphatase YjhB (NUDIX family)